MCVIIFCRTSCNQQDNGLRFSSDLLLSTILKVLWKSDFINIACNRCLFWTTWIVLTRQESARNYKNLQQSMWLSCKSLQDYQVKLQEFSSSLNSRDNSINKQLLKSKSKQTQLLFFFGKCFFTISVFSNAWRFSGELNKSPNIFLSSANTSAVMISTSQSTP